MSCRKDADTNCCYWMVMPPSDTGRTAAESQRLEARGITRLLRRSSAVPFLTYYIRTYKQLLHDNGIEFEDIPLDDWLREKPPSGPGINLMADFQVQQQQQQNNPAGGSRQSGKTKRRTHRKKGTRRRTKRYRTKTKRRRD